MDRRSMQQLRLDRRLIRRPGWIAKEELEEALEKLPDVSGKAAPAEAAKERTSPEGPSGV